MPAKRRKVSEEDGWAEIAEIEAIDNYVAAHRTDIDRPLEDVLFGVAAKSGWLLIAADRYSYHPGKIFIGLVAALAPVNGKRFLTLWLDESDPVNDLEAQLTKARTA